MQFPFSERQIGSRREAWVPPTLFLLQPPLITHLCLRLLMCCDLLQEEEECLLQEPAVEQSDHPTKEPCDAPSPAPCVAPREAEERFIFPHTRSRPSLPPSMPTLPEEEEDSPEEMDSSSSSPSTVSDAPLRHLFPCLSAKACEGGKNTLHNPFGPGGKSKSMPLLKLVLPPVSADGAPGRPLGPVPFYFYSRDKSPRFRSLHISLSWTFFFFWWFPA